MQDDKKVVDFDSAKEPLVHRRREDKVDRLRRAFAAAREAMSPPKAKSKLQKKSSKKRKKKK